MKLYGIRGGTRDALESKQYNIGIGISLGNKWFTQQNILEQIKWSLAYARESIVVYVADTIHAINIEIRDRKSPEAALTIAQHKGQAIIETVRDLAVTKLKTEDFAKLIFATWNDITDAAYKQKVDRLYHFYNHDQAFHHTIQNIVRQHVATEARQFTDDEINRFCHYIIEELPEVINRVAIKDVICDAYVYPFDGQLAELTEQIQLGTVFPDVRQAILDTPPKVLLVVR